MSSDKKKKIFTIMIIPHSERSTLSISIPLWIFQAIGIGLIISFSTLLIFANTYQNQKVELAEYKMKAEEYDLLRGQMDYFAKETEMIQERMKTLKKLDSDIRDLIKDDPAIEKLEDDHTILQAYNEKDDDDLFRIASMGGSFEISSNPTTIREHMNLDIANMNEEVEIRETSLEDLKSGVEERHERLAATPSIWPVNNARITSPFGYRRSPFTGRQEFHRGIDLANSYGAPIYATHDGVVSFSGYRGGYGWTIVISNDQGFSTLYAHNSTNLVSVGKRVSKGDLIARIGTSGSTTGPHVHYEVEVNGRLVNPREYMY